ncbi:hypothetical protein RND81_01G101800 [Saponaria officinalis]|uniref:Uncharacterized protein n=1 Tax=Saponaria officinalis TaxID=3572 RepID=A0AAW1NFV5_SAPOF
MGIFDSCTPSQMPILRRILPSQEAHFFFVVRSTTCLCPTLSEYQPPSQNTIKDHLTTHNMLHNHLPKINQIPKWSRSKLITTESLSSKSKSLSSKQTRCPNFSIGGAHQTRLVG